MKKYATVRFIGNQNDYVSGQKCNEYVYCLQCEKNATCKRNRVFLFVKNKEYKAYFLDYLQGERNVLEVEAEKGELINFVPLSDFEIVSDKDNVLNHSFARVKCILTNGDIDLTAGKEYYALKKDDNNTAYYILDNSGDCYYYPKNYFIIVDDMDNILNER